MDLFQLNGSGNCECPILTGSMNISVIIGIEVDTYDKIETPYCTCSGRCSTKFFPCKRSNVSCTSAYQSSKRCSNVTVSVTTDLIDQTRMPDDTTPLKIWKKKAILTYFFEEHHITLIQGGCLNDNLIHASQSLIKKHNIHLIIWNARSHPSKDNFF